MKNKKTLIISIAILACLLIQAIPKPYSNENMLKTYRYSIIGYGIPFSTLINFKVKDLQTGKNASSEWFINKNSVLFNTATLSLLLFIIIVLLFKERIGGLYGWAIFSIVPLSLFIVILTLVSFRSAYLFVKEQKSTAFKKESLEKLEKLAKDKEFVENEKKIIKQQMEEKGFFGPWISKKLILMKNGEWAIYFQQDMKQDPVLGDYLFGITSDGRWFYTEKHICIDMFLFRMDIQCGKLDEIINDDNYGLKLFKTKPNVEDLHGWKKPEEYQR